MGNPSNYLDSIRLLGSTKDPFGPKRHRPSVLSPVGYHLQKSRLPSLLLHIKKLNLDPSQKIPTDGTLVGVEGRGDSPTHRGRTDTILRKRVVTRRDLGPGP